MVEKFFDPIFFSQYFFEIIKWCKNKQLKFMLQDLQRIRKHNLAVVVNVFLKVQTEKSLIIFLKSLNFFWIILFEFWLILFVSAAFFIILVEKFPIFFFFYLFYSEWFCLSFWCGFLKNDFLVQFFCMHLWWVFFFQLVTLGTF